MKQRPLEHELLYKMKRLRAVEETIAEKYHEQKMRCPVHLCTGQEGVSVAVGHALRTDDFAVSTHRAHGHYIGKGGDMGRMLAEIYGKKTGCASGKGGSMHLIDESVGFMGSTAIVGNTIPVGVGLGLSIQLKKTDQVSCVFLGDGAVEEGAFWEAANFAVLKKLPVLFMCENNFYSVYSHLRVRQPMHRKIFELAKSIGMPAYFGDGNDVVSVYHQVAKELPKIRVGQGPVFFEYTTYRWREHCGPGFDNDIGYRTEEEYLEWKEKDPVVKLERELLSTQKITPAELSADDESIRKEVMAAFDFAERSPFPEAKEAYTDLYGEAAL